MSLSNFVLILDSLFFFFLFLVIFCFLFQISLKGLYVIFIIVFTVYLPCKFGYFPAYSYWVIIRACGHHLSIIFIANQVASKAIMFVSNLQVNNGYYMGVWLQIKKLVYFIIQLSLATIYEPHCTFWYYSWVQLYYFN